MAEALVMARNIGTANKKGDIVEWRANDTVYGTAECLPDFVVIKVSDILLKETENTYPRRLETRQKVEEISNYSKTLSVKFSNENAGATKGVLTQNQIDKDLADFGGMKVSEATNECIVSYNIDDLVKSKGFLPFHDDKILLMKIQNINEDVSQLYYEIDYKGVYNNTTYVERYIGNMTGVFVLFHAKNVIRFSIQRSKLIEIMQKQLSSRNPNEIVEKWRFSISESIVDNIIASGGVITIDNATLITQIKDKKD